MENRNNIKEFYKIGKTIQLPEERFKGYSKNSYPLRIFLVDDCDMRETELLAIFNNKFRLARGREYFDGNVIQMVYEFCNFCNQYDILEKTLINSDIMKNNEIIKICNSKKIEDIKKDIKKDIKLSNNFECDKCFRMFNTKQQLQRHSNLNNCRIVTNFQCLRCLQYFKSKHTLTEHKTCKSINIEKINELKKNELKDNIKDEIFINTQQIKYNKIEIGFYEIVNSEFTIEEKIKFIKNYNINKLSDDDLKKLLLLNKASYIFSLIN